MTRRPKRLRQSYTPAAGDFDFARYSNDPVAFIDALIPLNEKGKPWRLAPHQRRVLALALHRGARGELRFRLVLWSEPKKSGKTFLAAVLLIWWAITNPDTEIIVVANDLEQAVDRVFRTAVALCKFNPVLAASVTTRATEIRVSNGTVITAIASEYRGAAGSRHSLVVFDELWGYGNERAQRLYEELTPPPTEENAWVLIVTYAGFAGESTLLEAMYARGLAGERVDAELELYEADGLFMFWSHTPRQPWQTEGYYAEQQRSLRPATFARLHRNEWVTAESVLVTPALWDGCIDAGHAPLPPTPGLALAVGIDASYRRDCTAVVALAQGLDGRLVLARHRIWTPRPEAPLNLEQTVEAYVLALASQFYVVKVLADPFQLISSIARLGAAGVPIEAYPQSVPNTTMMATTVLDLLRDRQLVLYPDAEFRAHALATVGIESPRGFRIAKEKASQKIDAVVALAMASVAAQEAFTAEAAEAARVAQAMDPLQIAHDLARIDAAIPAWRDLRRARGEPYGGWDNVVGDGLDDGDDDYTRFGL